MAKRSPKSAERDGLPDISPEFGRFAELNPEFGIPLSKRAEDLLRAVFFDKEGRELPWKEIATNIEIFRERLRAIVPQLEQNSRWKELLQVVNARKAHAHQAAQRTSPVQDLQLKTLQRYQKPEEFRVASSEQEFKEAPRVLKKTLQEILTAPTERLVHPREDVEKRNPDFSDLVVDPENINNTLLENLGLDDFKPKKRSNPVKKMAASAAAVPAIKEMLSDLEPFQLAFEKNRSQMHYFRLMRIGKGKNEGYLLGTQRTNGKKILFKTDLHGAYRRIDHIEEEYVREIAILARIVDKIKEIDFKVAREWQRLKDSAELEEMKNELFGMVEQLKFVNNGHKVKMRKMIEGCVTFQTQQKMPAKKGRPAEVKTIFNPGAMRAKWNTVKDYVGRRVKEIAQIKKYLAEDQTRIQEYIETQQAPFERFYKTVEEMHQKFKILDENRPLTEDDKANISRNLLRVKAECVAGSTAFFEPYLSFAKKMVEHIDATVAKLSGEAGDVGAKNDRVEIASEFLKIYLVTKIQYFFNELQKFYDEFLSPEKVPYFVELLREIERLNSVIYQKRIGRAIKTQEYDAVFGEIYHLLNSLRKKARLGKQEMSKKSGKHNAEASKIKDLMHDQVRDFKFDELLRSITQS